MKTAWVPAKDILIKWDKTVKERLFPEHFHNLFNPKRILAPLEQSSMLEATREKRKLQVDYLIDTVLAYSTLEVLEQKLLSTDPMLVALYYDRICYVTWWIDHFLPLRENEPCEVPEDWNTFVSLVLHQKWFV
jgi:hypothetical protein